MQNIQLYLFLSTTTALLSLSADDNDNDNDPSLRIFLLVLLSLLTLLSFLLAVSFRHATLRNKLTKRIKPCYNARGMVSARGGIMNHTREAYASLAMGFLWAVVGMTVWNGGGGGGGGGGQDAVEEQEVVVVVNPDDAAVVPSAKNGNLYYSTGASALSIAYLVADLLTVEDPNGTLPLYYRPRNRIHLSYALLFFVSVALFSFAAAHASGPACDEGTFRSATHCRRSVLTALLAGWNAAIVGLHAGLVSVERNDPHPLPSETIRKRRGVVDAVLSVMALVASAINVGISTSVDGPGREPGNVFWGCWVCFAIALHLVVCHVEMVLYPNGRVENDIMEEGLMHHYEVMRRKKYDDDDDDDDFGKLYKKKKKKKKNNNNNNNNKTKKKRKVSSKSSTSASSEEDEEEDDEDDEEEIPLHRQCYTNAAPFRYHPNSPGSPGSYNDNSTITTYPEFHRRVPHQVHSRPPPPKPTGTSSGDDDPNQPANVNKLDERIQRDRDRHRRMFLAPDPSTEGRRNTISEDPPPPPPTSPGAAEIHLAGAGTRPATRERKSRNKALESPGVRSRDDLPKVVRASPGGRSEANPSSTSRRRTFSGSSEDPAPRSTKPQAEDDDRDGRSLRPSSSSSSFAQPRVADESVGTRHGIRSTNASRPRGRILYPPEENTARDVVPRAPTTYHILELKKQDLLNSRAERRERAAAATPPPEESPDEKSNAPSVPSFQATKSPSSVPSPETKAASVTTSPETKAASLEPSSEEGSDSQTEDIIHGDSDVERYVKRALKVAASADKTSTAVHDDDERPHHHSMFAGMTRSVANDGIPRNLSAAESIYGKHDMTFDDTRSRKNANYVVENERGRNRSFNSGNVARQRRKFESHGIRRDTTATTTTTTTTTKRELPPPDAMQGTREASVPNIFDGIRPRALSSSRTFSDIEKSSSGSDDRNDSDPESRRKSHTSAESGKVQSSPDSIKVKSESTNDKSSPESSGNNKSSHEKSSPDTVRVVDSGSRGSFTPANATAASPWGFQSFARPFRGLSHQSHHSASGGNNTQNDQRMAVDNLVAEALERAKSMKHEYEGRKSLVRGSGNNNNGNFVEIQVRSEQSAASPDSPTEEVSVYSYFSNSNSQSSKSGNAAIGSVYPC